MGSDKKTIEERLTEQLEKKDNEIEALQNEVNHLNNQLRNSANGVYAHRLMSSTQTLPVPRLEITVTPTGDQQFGKWYKRIYDYRLVIHSEWGDFIAVPLGRTDSMGGHRNETPVHMMGPYAGQPTVPFRLAHYICHDMRSLQLPGFVVCEELVRDISELANRPNEL